MSSQKRILFVSALDFKEKSIQVIRKTPEAYVKAGWHVDYLVARDTSSNGNYFYEKPFDPDGVNVTRITWSLMNLRKVFRHGIPGKLAVKLSALCTIKKLRKYAKAMVNDGNYDVIYGYELHGVLAISKINTLTSRRISRFQGTWLTMYHREKRKLKLWLNKEAIRALRVPSDLCIMTNDGTQGDVAMKVLGDLSAHSKFVFWTNGVDHQKLERSDFQELINTYKPNGEFVFLTVSRLESWKRLDRVIKSFITFLDHVPDSTAKLLIVGDGSARAELEDLAKGYHNIQFIGAVPHQEVKKYLNMADAFISMYDLSNVGNPLLEAIRCNKIIFTLNNGDTASWIQHEVNGFIYDPDKELYKNAARDFARVTTNKNLQAQIVSNVELTAREKLWTWEERFNAEVAEVTRLING